MPLALCQPACTASCGGGRGRLGLPAILDHAEMGPHGVVSLSSCSRGTAAAARVQIASRLMLVRIQDVPPGKAPCVMTCGAAATFGAPWPCCAGLPTVLVTLALSQPVDAVPAIGRGWRRPGVLLGAVATTAMPLMRNSLGLPVLLVRASLGLPVLGRLLLPLVPGALHSVV